MAHCAPRLGMVYGEVPSRMYVSRLAFPTQVGKLVVYTVVRAAPGGTARAWSRVAYAPLRSRACCAVPSSP